MSEKIIIIGGGIGGATAALALQKIGVEVEIYERAPELREVGAGLALWVAPFRALQRLGVGEKIRQCSTPLGFSELCLPSGKIVRRLEIEKLLGAEFNENFIIHRADLHAAILSGLEKNVVRTGHECERIEQTSGGVKVFFKNGVVAEGALLVGADGFHSIVRKELFGETATRYSGQTCYRAVADTHVPSPSVLAEIQGSGQRFGIAPINEKRVYWFAAMNAAAGETDDPAERRAFLREKFKDWAFGIPEMIAAPGSDVLRNDLADRPPLKTWVKGRAGLLGDAAHPMLPNLGQGACTAIEDGFVLAKNVAKNGVRADALKAFEAERLGRTTRIVNQSWQFGIPVAWTNPLAVWLREKMLEYSPESLTAKVFRENICYDVGDLRESFGH
jgi:2-polyprenyl-6-methoxyphenol hydroxylase-like FAD-dependent oxidoreductase